MAILGSHALASLPIYQPIGASTALGGYANRQAFMTSLANPAAPYMMTNIESARVGFLGPLSLGYETGDIKNLDDKIDELEGILELDYSASYNNLSATDLASLGLTLNSTDAEISAALIQADADVAAAINQANGIITEIGKTAYVKLSGSVQAPFMPIIYKTSNRGAFTLDASASFVGRVGILSDDISATVSGSDVELVSDTSVYVKRATDYRFGLGYSQALGRPISGALILGGRLNFHKMALGQKLSVLTDEENDADDGFGDFLFERENVESGISLDLGAIWTAPNYQLGASLANVNEPEFDFAELGNCSGLSGSELTSCNAAVRLSNGGKLDLKETYKMRAQLTLDAAVMTTDQNWSLAVSYDANHIADPVGDEYQWEVISLSYFNDDLLLPGIRVGYRRNHVGSKLRYITAGATLFRRLELDLAYGLDKFTHDGSSLPRSLYFSVGYSFGF
ncbi:conjugal transfer protein TraF [Marinomonas transparens]|uniref:Conjugal transfer protein TraF n=1 Tax=Marinomonas transparens TaxID=2795388 RepID=A0A934N5C1_9GAMM|nr:conjugal transfer protein TraF [Marinomonas transparens]MBJ7536891.1 conjugal transfer protein TraF [Marinomonas transparens]